MLDLKIKTRLTPADFKQQLYIGLVAIARGWFYRRLLYMLPRVEIEWGQRYIRIPVTEPGLYIGAEIYDRQEGGEPLAGGQWWPDMPPVSMTPKDTVALHINSWGGA